MNIESKSDRLSAACLDLLGTRDLHRQDKVFRAKERIIGIDKDALNHQVNERKHRDEDEANMSKLFAADLMRTNHAACVLDNKLKREERLLNSSIVQFRKNFQQPINRREFDLNDPDILKKQEGVQILPGLAGEDPNNRERLKRQQMQVRQWCLQQQAESRRAKDQLRHSDKLYEASRLELDKEGIMVQKLEEEQKRAFAIATKDANMTMAWEAKERALRRKHEEEENNRMDIQNQLRGDLLCESPKQSISVLRTPHVRCEFYKGMTSDEVKHIIRCQQQQVEEKKRTCAQQRQDEHQEEQIRLASSRSALLLERQQVRANKQLRRDLDNANAQLAEARRAREKWLEKEFYTNIPNEGYFAQFNTGSR